MTQRATALTILLALVCTSCSKGGFSSRNTEKPKDTFTASMSVNPSTLDPAQSQDVPTNDLMAMVFEGLVAWSADDQLTAKLAESWIISPDGSTYTFTIRKTTFHDGRPVRAKDFKATWERNCSPSIQSPTPGGYLGDIAGVDEVISGKRKDISGVKALDDRTLVVTLKQPRASFLGKLTYPVAAVMPEGTGSIAGPKEMIGTGPFRVADYTPEAQIELERNPNYPGDIAPSKLVLVVVKDASTRVNLLRNGKLDWAGLPQADVPAFRKDAQFTLIEADRPATFYLGMNGNIYAPFADPRVRRAFNHAIDKDRIVRDVLNGLGTVASGYLPPSVPQAPGLKPALVFDPAKAKRLVQESGWAGRLPALELWLSDPNGDRKRVAEMAVSMLRENLGVQAELRLVESSVLIQRATKRELPFFMGSWYMDYLDPENLLSVLLSAYGQNRTAYDNPKFTDLCRKADAMQNGPARLETYREAELLAIQDSPWIPLYHPREATAVRKGVVGIESNAFGLMAPIRAQRR